MTISPSARPVVLDARDVDHHAIPVHGGLGGFARNVDIAAQPFDGMIGRNEAIAVAVHVEAAGHVLAAQAREHEVAGFHFDQVAVLLQAVESGVELFAGRSRGFRAHGRAV